MLVKVFVAKMEMGGRSKAKVKTEGMSEDAKVGKDGRHIGSCKSREDIQQTKEG